MADFHKAFEAIDEDGSGEITVDELQHYMIKNNYKASFVSKWLTLFDGDKHYCERLVPKEREPLDDRKDAGREETIRESRTAGETGQPPKRKEEEIKPIKTTGEATQPSKTATETVRPAKTTGEATQPSKTAAETVRQAKTTDARTKPTADSADAPKSAPVNPQLDPQSPTVPSKAVHSNKKAASAPPQLLLLQKKK